MRPFSLSSSLMRPFSSFLPLLSALILPSLVRGNAVVEIIESPDLYGYSQDHVWPSANQPISIQLQINRDHAYIFNKDYSLPLKITHLFFASYKLSPNYKPDRVENIASVSPRVRLSAPVTVKDQTKPVTLEFKLPDILKGNGRKYLLGVYFELVGKKYPREQQLIYFANNFQFRVPVKYEHQINEAINSRKTAELRNYLMIATVENDGDISYLLPPLLDKAVMGGSVETVKVLVEHGAQIQERHGESAIRSGHQELANYIYDKLGQNSNRLTAASDGSFGTIDNQLLAPNRVQLDIKDIQWAQHISRMLQTT